MNKKIVTIGFFILIVFIVLVFFSKTIYQYNRPTVTGVLPQTGKLTKKENVSGIAEWTNIEEVYAEIAGKTEELFVSEGDKIEKGQPVARLSFDTEAAETKLLELAAARDKLLLNIETTQKQIRKATGDIAALNDETYDKDAPSSLDIQQLEKKIKMAEENYGKNKILYDAGVINKKELDDISAAIDSLRADLEKLKQTQQESLKNTADDIKEKEKNRTKQISQLNDTIDSGNQNLKGYQLDLKINGSEQERTRKQLEKFDSNIMVYAPANGEIISLKMKKGQLVTDNQLLLSMGTGNEFTIKCEIGLKNNFVKQKDFCKISNTDHKFEAEVSKIVPGERMKEVSIKIASDELTAGETFDINFEKESADSKTLVPNGAINKDNDGYFVYMIKQREGILGEEFYVRKQKVTLGDSDQQNTVITGGITFFEPLVLLSDKSFSEDSVVKLKNEVDFFAQK